MAMRSAQIGAIGPSIGPVGDLRKRSRRDLVLRVGASVRDTVAADVVIHNLSTTGLLMETDADLSQGEAFIVEVPHAGPVRATVVWAGERMFGCTFEQAITPAAVSAALLRAPIAAAPSREEVASPPRHESLSGDLPPHKKFWIVAGLALFAWAAIIAAGAWLAT